MPPEKIKHIVEAALLAAARPLNLDQLQGLFEETEKPEKSELRQALKVLAGDFAGHSIELKEVASGWRVQVRAEYAQWTSRLWEERPTRYSRALLETLALIAYRQPVTRGEIEDVRGVSVSTNIIKTMLDRNWIRIVGHRDVPGRPAMFGTTRDFLDYFGLKSLDELPTLAELRDIDSINAELDFDGPRIAAASRSDGGGDDGTNDDRVNADTVETHYDTQENTQPGQENDADNEKDGGQNDWQDDGQDNGSKDSQQEAAHHEKNTAEEASNAGPDDENRETAFRNEQ